MFVTVPCIHQENLRITDRNTNWETGGGCLTFIVSKKNSKWAVLFQTCVRYIDLGLDIAGDDTR